ncbi:hypothetical protein KSC_002210 [Ktedonobacter sp. SOSP1-52]|uniref:hypothetical protein n=1 Tax=Ktedonobacter sp. SOSP1-52 TaxID=2778366 RepID=UPI0019152954|nr:hypothetical protein [Ktedonobacter sp. SOSP1-52]GHO61329.1 hypothetical protein KSC_002210 [Ktedonobacter sp. SOSP1-52]
MRFFPEDTAPEYRAESDVWDIVKEALKDDDGVAWHGYRLYRKGRSYSYAPDIFVLSRHYGAIVIECKGCLIDNIDAIYNIAWEMVDWYKPQITPVTQVENQRLEIQRLLRQKNLPPERLRFRVMVALPFITRTQWADKGFAEEEAIKPVALAEDLTVDGFLAWLDQCQRESPQSQLAASEWSAIVKALGGGQQEATQQAETTVPQNILPTQPSPAREEQVVFLTYEGNPPHDDLLRNRLGLPYLNTWTSEKPMPDYWYLVPTAGLEWQRRNLAPEIQIQERLRREISRQQEFGVKLLFRKALIHFMALGPQPRIATRVSELVHLRRAVFSLDLEPEMREQVLRDRYAWIEAIRAVEEEGLDLTVSSLEHENLFVDPAVAELMGKIQTSFRQQLTSQDEVLFETAARAFLLSDDFQPPPLVVMEGFTRLTPLQLLFVERCLRIPKCTIWFILPFRATQVEGFEAIKHTYHKLQTLPHKKVQELLRGLREPTALVALQQSLFSEESVRGTGEPESVVIEAYPTRQQEVAACVQHLKRYLDANPEHQIAVVTRDPLKYRTLLREEAALLDPAFAERFDIPPAHLLLTPVGRFVLSLYNAWSNGKLILHAELFRSILASGWLGRRAKNSVPLFRSIEPAFFAHCENYDSWQRAFTALDAAISKSAAGRTLAAWCTPDDSALWRKAMDIVVSLTQQLFDGQTRILSEQILRLQSTLETLDLQDVQEDEKKIIRNILIALQSFQDSSELELDAEEVGEVLNSLIRQREDAENHERITVTGPESLDGLQKDIIYYLGVDEHRVPRPPGDNWPLAEIDSSQQQHQIQERYLFLATVRAATKNVHLTYAEIDDRQACGPSLYLDEVARILEYGQVPFADRPTAGEQQKVETTIDPIGFVQRDTYAVGELAQFQVCPRRYYLQRMTRTGNYYRDPWQVRFLVQSALLTHALTAFQTQYPSGVQIEKFPDIMSKLALEAALAQAKATYTGYTDADWFFLAQQTQSRLVNAPAWIKQHWPAELIVRVESRQDAFVSLRGSNGRTINLRAATRFVIRGGDRRYVYTEDLLAEEWLLPSRNNDPTDSRYQAVRWWGNLIRNVVKSPHSVHIGNPMSIKLNNTQYELASIEEVIAQVEKGIYQAHPGDHCHYCPVKSLCIGWQTGGLL